MTAVTRHVPALVVVNLLDVMLHPVAVTSLTPQVTEPLVVPPEVVSVSWVPYVPVMLEILREL